MKKAIPIVLSIMILVGCRNERPIAPKQENRTNAEIARVVYLYRSEACECESERNEDAEGVLSMVSNGSTTARPFERIDVFAKPDLLETFSKKTTITFLPVLLALNADDEVVGQVDGFFSEETVRPILLPSN